ncbi:Light regulated Lir1 [Cynara cardunculus var. scolymus]|uniref:Light regulated Lir1 n=1 Tax=Cynara cardunculus var. scolymus TaxID=59895 RepID=A0A103YLK9_CYNCS|nr:Light regulated Lir1 [Cynara cardunculus var. scolymus]
MRSVLSDVGQARVAGVRAPIGTSSGSPSYGQNPGNKRKMHRSSVSAERNKPVNQESEDESSYEILEDSKDDLYGLYLIALNQNYKMMIEINLEVDLLDLKILMAPYHPSGIFLAEACETVGGIACDVEMFSETKLREEAKPKAKVTTSQAVDREYVEYNSIDRYANAPAKRKHIFIRLYKTNLTELKLNSILHHGIQVQEAILAQVVKCLFY